MVKEGAASDLGTGLGELRGALPEVSQVLAHGKMAHVATAAANAKGCAMEKVPALRIPREQLQMEVAQRSHYISAAEAVRNVSRPDFL
jgi:hypothetical protein